MELIKSGKTIYSLETVGSATIQKYYDHEFHIDIEYIDSIVYFTVKDYLNRLADGFNAPITATINGVAQTINIAGGVGTYAITSDWVTVVTNHADVRNGSLSIGSEPDRISQLEADNAMLMLALAEAELRQTQTDQTLAELMLAIASGGV